MDRRTSLSSHAPFLSSAPLGDSEEEGRATKQARTTTTAISDRYEEEAPTTTNHAHLANHQHHPHAIGNPYHHSAGRSPGGAPRRSRGAARPHYDYYASDQPISALTEPEGFLHWYEGGDDGGGDDGGGDDGNEQPRSQLPPAIFVAQDTDISATGAEGGGGSTVRMGPLDYYGPTQTLSTSGRGGAVGVSIGDVRHPWHTGRQARVAGAASGSGRDLDSTLSSLFVDEDEEEAAARLGRHGPDVSGDGRASQQHRSNSIVSWCLKRRCLSSIVVLAVVILAVAIANDLSRPSTPEAPADTNNNNNNVGSEDEKESTGAVPTMAPSNVHETTLAPTVLQLAPPFASTGRLTVTSFPTLQPVSFLPPPLPPYGCTLCADGSDPQFPNQMMFTDAGEEVSCGDMADRIDDRVSMFQRTVQGMNANESCEIVQQQAKSLCGCGAAAAATVPTINTFGGNASPMASPPSSGVAVEGYDDNGPPCSLCPVSLTAAANMRIDLFLRDDMVSFTGQSVDGRPITTCANVAAFLDQEYTVADDQCTQVIADYASFCCASPGQPLPPPPMAQDEECELCPGGGVLGAPNNLIFPLDQEQNAEAETCEEFSHRVTQVALASANPSEECKRYQTMASTNCGCTVFPHPDARCKLCPDGSRPPIFVLHEPVYLMKHEDGSTESVTCADLVLQAAMASSDSECHDMIEEWAPVCQCPGYVKNGAGRSNGLEAKVPGGIGGGGI